jgi:hypothetical protein
MATKKVSARERKLQVLLKEADKKYSALETEHEGLWTDFEEVQRFAGDKVDEIRALKKKYEPEIRPYKLTELETVIRQRIVENLDDVNKLPWLVGTGAESASTKIDSVVALLNSEVNGNDEILTKTMRVVRNAVLNIYKDVADREVATMMRCPCLYGEGQHSERRHHDWPHYTAGCFVRENERGNRIRGRIWDVAEFLKLHSGYEMPKLVAHAAILALQQISSELQGKEQDLTRLVEKIRVNQKAVDV